MSTVNKINVNGNICSINNNLDDNIVSKINDLNDSISIDEYGGITDEICFSNDDETETYVIINKNGIYSKNFYDIEGNLIENKIEQKLPTKAFTNEAELTPLDILLLPSIHIQKNFLLSSEINGSIENVDFGVGYINSPTYENRTYNARWITLTQTTIVLKASYNTGQKEVKRYTHNLSLTEKTKILIIGEINKNIASTTLKLFNDIGDVYTIELGEWGVGCPFILNSGTTNISTKISFMPRDINKDIWVFGDSYFSFTSNSSWPYYMAELDCINWLSNNQPGLSPQGGYNDLVNLLTLNNIPKKVLWCLGMNGDTTESKSSGEYIINSYQKTYIDKVYNLSKEYNFELIITTIPTVPERQKTGFNKYIKNLDIRVIDFANAVGTNELGEWNDGLLGSDNVHPTHLGAKVLFSKINIDFPELTIK